MVLQTRVNLILPPDFIAILPQFFPYKSTVDRKIWVFSQNKGGLGPNWFSECEAIITTIYWKASKYVACAVVRCQALGMTR